MLVGVTNSSVELYSEKLAANLAAVHISATVCIELLSVFFFVANVVG